MRKLLFCLSFIIALASSVQGFDVSPTQVADDLRRDMPTSPNSILTDAILANSGLSAGLELLSVACDGSRIESMRGTLSEPISGDPAQAGIAFIRENAKLFNIPIMKGADSIKTESVFTDNLGATHLVYRMVCGGLEVYRANIDLHLGKDRRVQLANGSFPTVNGLANSVVLRPTEAIEAAQKAIRVSVLRSTSKVELVVFPDHDQGLLAYCVRVAAKKPLGDFEILVDAQTGRELLRLNQMMFADNETEWNGLGSVYLHHPLVSSITSEVLPHLSTQTLTGLWADVINEDCPCSTNQSNQHIYVATDTHFDEVMMYYHINKVHDFFKELGQIWMDKPMKAMVHYGDNYDNAYYSPWDDSMYFGDGDTFNDLSKEESVCYHEYAHANLNSIKNLVYKGESGAINEGQADYFACSLSDDPKVGEWAVAKMNEDSLRDLTTKVHYPEDIHGEVHVDGLIWGATLWDLRMKLGANISDQLVYQSLRCLKANSPTFVDGLNAILVADTNVFQGKYKLQILEVFGKKGIGASSPSATVLRENQLRTMRTFRSVHGE
ncbi:MAG: M36 family metallopeptidase [Candidatus Ozemobacteraceae bacterium]